MTSGKAQQLQHTCGAKADTKNGIVFVCERCGIVPAKECFGPLT